VVTKTAEPEKPKVAAPESNAQVAPSPEALASNEVEAAERAGENVPSQDDSLPVDILSAEIDEVTGEIIESKPTGESADESSPFAASEPSVSSAAEGATEDGTPKFSGPRAPSQSTNYVDFRLLQELKEEQEEEDDSDLVYEPLIKPETKEKKDEKKVEVIEEPNEMRGMVRRVKRSAAQKNIKPLSTDNKVLKILEKNPLGMTLPEMAGGTRKQSRIKLLRPMLAQAIKEGLVMPVSQRAGHTVYKLVKNISH
jgi:hypothetical protein